MSELAVLFQNCKWCVIDVILKVRQFPDAISNAMRLRRPSPKDRLEWGSNPSIGGAEEQYWLIPNCSKGSFWFNHACLVGHWWFSGVVFHHLWSRDIHLVDSWYSWHAPPGRLPAKASHWRLDEIRFWRELNHPTRCFGLDYNYPLRPAGNCEESFGLVESRLDAAFPC